MEKQLENVQFVAAKTKGPFILFRKDTNNDSKGRTILVVEKKVVVNFEYKENKYELIIYRNNGQWYPHVINHLTWNPICGCENFKNDKSCMYMERFLEEIFGAVLPLVRLKLLYV